MMATLAILRQRKVFSDCFVVPVRSIQRTLSQGQSCQRLDSRSFSSATDDFSQTSDHRRDDDQTLFLKKELLNFSLFGIIRHKAYGSSTFLYGTGRLNFSYLMGAKLMSQSTRYASTATANKPDLGSDDEDNREMAAEKRKEASPEECDQAVVGLSTAKAKAKAKKLQESRNVVKSIFKRLWAKFLGKTGPRNLFTGKMSLYQHCSITGWVVSFCGQM